jgi:hypothetical protein
MLAYEPFLLAGAPHRSTGTGRSAA